MTTSENDPLDTTSDHPGEELPVSAVVDRRRMRRAPRFGRFILVGVLLGAIAAWLLSQVPPSQLAIDRGQDLSPSLLFLLLFLAFGSVGGILGVGIALLVDRRSLRRRAKRMRD